MVVRLATVLGVLPIGRVLLVMPWVPVRGSWGGEGDSAVGRDGGGPVSPVWVRLVTRSTLSTRLGPRRPMVAVEAGDVSMLWCLVCVASARYLWCACWRGYVDGGGLSACLPVELVPAVGGCLCLWRWR